MASSDLDLVFKKKLVKSGSAGQGLINILNHSTGNVPFPLVQFNDIPGTVN